MTGFLKMLRTTVPQCNNGVSLFFVIALYLVGVLFLVTIGCLSYRDYNYFVHHRIEELTPIKKFYEANCMDSAAITDRGAHEDCHWRGHRMKEDPNTHAMYDTLERWGICGDGECIKRLSSIGQPLMLVLSTAVVSVLLTTLIGLCLLQRLKTLRGENILPMQLTTQYKKEI